ncbi:hypothetical protein H5200_06875 [Pseudoalteromonas sp. SG43-7]|uniref:hypothetical protein n=1 Tax=unclassified Pseudoalteromonas TaxID=194690 RepID=UPI001600FA76|nr:MULTISPECIES: hypothetical protein [unclassified Pseudoalteromonas]MBB1295099.1 hypothetical protein [Pseudoalteromonas sp. SR41-4]MBB1421639.1 hypothetical protein [Pseudoalteromonas sp. SG43-7]
MVQDLIKGWFSDNKVKITSPVLGAFVGAWVLFNWKYFLLLFWGKGDLEVRLLAFEEIIIPSNLSVWLWPLLVALIYAFGLPYLNVLSHKLLKRAEEWRHSEVVGIDIIKAKKKTELNEVIYKGDPANPYLGKKLEAELKELEARADTKRAEANSKKVKLEELEAQKKASIAEQKKLELEAEQEELKLKDLRRRDEREKLAQERAKAHHHQEILNARFPTAYVFLKYLSESFIEDEVNAPIDFMMDCLVICFGYRNSDELLVDDDFSLSQLQELSCVAYSNSTILKALSELIKKSRINVTAEEVFDHLVQMFENMDTVRFMSDDLFKDLASEFAGDSDNYDLLLHEDSVTGSMAETNAEFEFVEDVHVIGVEERQDGEVSIKMGATVSGTSNEDKMFSGDSIDVVFSLAFYPTIGGNGYSQPEIENVSSSVSDSWRE